MLIKDSKVEYLLKLALRKVFFWSGCFLVINDQLLKQYEKSVKNSRTLKYLIILNNTFSKYYLTGKEPH